MSMDKELVDIAKKYAKLKYTSVTQIVRDYFLQLKSELEALESQSNSFERSEQHEGAVGAPPYDSTETNETETQ